MQALRYKEQTPFSREELISNVMARCRGTQISYHEATGANLLARAQHGLGDDIGCRKTLEPYRDLAQQSDEEIMRDNLPSVAADVQGMAQESRENLIACGADSKLYPKSTFTPVVNSGTDAPP